jgi:hypothetical protein
LRPASETVRLTRRTKFSSWGMEGTVGTFLISKFGFRLFSVMIFAALVTEIASSFACDSRALWHDGKQGLAFQLTSFLAA